MLILRKLSSIFASTVINISSTVQPYINIINSEKSRTLCRYNQEAWSFSIVWLGDQSVEEIIRRSHSIFLSAQVLSRGSSSSLEAYRDFWKISNIDQAWGCSRQVTFSSKLLEKPAASQATSYADTVPRLSSETYDTLAVALELSFVAETSWPAIFSTLLKNYAMHKNI